MPGVKAKQRLIMFATLWCMLLKKVDPKKYYFFFKQPITYKTKPEKANMVASITLKIAVRIDFLCRLDAFGHSLKGKWVSAHKTILEVLKISLVMREKWDLSCKIHGVDECRLVRVGIALLLEKKRVTHTTQSP